MIIIGSDHRGFKVKNEIKNFLKSQKISYIDAVAVNPQEQLDYPEVALIVAKQVAKSVKNKGILICGSGIGMSIAANKIKRIHAAVVWNELVAKKSREDNDANILCLSADFVSLRQNISIVGIWLKTDFSNAFRHKKRIEKINKLDK